MLVHDRIGGSMTKVGPNPKNVDFDSWIITKRKNRVASFTFVNHVPTNDSRSMFLPNAFDLFYRRILNLSR